LLQLLRLLTYRMNTSKVSKKNLVYYLHL